MKFLLFIFSLSLQAETFMELAHKKTQQQMDEIIRSPFIVELSKGTLSPERFEYFSKQDQLYVWHYTDAMSLLSLRSANYTQKLFLLQGARESLQEWNGVRPENRRQCPSCLAYSQFELEHVKASYPAGLAAILPCYVVYWEVGQWLLAHPTPDNPYQYWVNDYADPVFGQHTHMIEQMVNDIYETASEEDREKMLEIYARAVRYEYEFWESAYKLVPLGD